MALNILSFGAKEPKSKKEDLAKSTRRTFLLSMTKWSLAAVAVGAGLHVFGSEAAAWNNWGWRHPDHHGWPRGGGRWGGNRCWEHPRHCGGWINHNGHRGNNWGRGHHRGWSNWHGHGGGRWNNWGWGHPGGSWVNRY